LFKNDAAIIVLSKQFSPDSWNIQENSVTQQSWL